MAPHPWTTPDQLVATLRRRWDRGDDLRAHARGEPWTPLTLPIKGPGADDLLADANSVLAWSDDMRKASVDRRGRERFSIEYRTVSNRLLGQNSVPARIRLDSLGQLCEVLGTTREVERLDAILDVTRHELAAATKWVADHPGEALAHHEVWPQVLAVATWIIEQEASATDLRHLDVPGIDTKFVERYRKVLGSLLDDVLPGGRIDPSAADFARRYGFRPRPRYVRLRLLAPVPSFPSQLTEVELRVDELAGLPLPVTTVFVVENQASYLAFPELPDAIAVFGGGYAVTTLELVPWLAERNVVYWGDIDTHGFVILDRLRERVPSVRSMLMDRATLLAHRAQLTNEPSPTNAPLPHLTVEEAALYRDLVEDRYGPAIRLEQERVRFALVRSGLAGWGAVAQDRG